MQPHLSGGSSPHVLPFDLYICVLVKRVPQWGRRDVASQKAGELKVSMNMLLHRLDMHHECRTPKS